MESITKMYQLVHMLKPDVRALTWLNTCLIEVPTIDERIAWLQQAHSSEIDTLQKINIPAEEVKHTHEDCALLLKFYLRVKDYMLHDQETASIINSAPAEDRFLYEVGAYLKSFSPADLVAYAQAFHADERDKTKNNTETILCTPQYEDCMTFEDVCSFCRSLFMAEGMRQHFIKGDPNDRTMFDIHSFPLKLRNACFDEYIRLSIKEIEEELSDDNDRLFEVTEIECLDELYKKEKCAYDRIVGMEQFRGSEAYAREWYPAKPHVIKMSGYFVQYLAHHIQKKLEQPNSPSSTTINVQPGATFNDIHDNSHIAIQ